MANQNVETVKNGYAAFAAGDIEGVLNLFDDNIEWITAGNSTISGTYHSKAELLDMFAKLAEKATSVRPLQFLSDGDVVVVLAEVTAGGQTGQEADVWTLRDGKIVKAQLHGDTAMMERVFGIKQAVTH